MYQIFFIFTIALNIRNVGKKSFNLARKREGWLFLEETEVLRDINLAECHVSRFEIVNIKILVKYKNKNYKT